jgi:hypothetical protein
MDWRSPKNKKVSNEEDPRVRRMRELPNLTLPVNLLVKTPVL